MQLDDDAFSRATIVGIREQENSDRAWLGFARVMDTGRSEQNDERKWFLNSNRIVRN